MALRLRHSSSDEWAFTQLHELHAFALPALGTLFRLWYGIRQRRRNAHEVTIAILALPSGPKGEVLEGTVYGVPALGKVKLSAAAG